MKETFKKSIRKLDTSKKVMLISQNDSLSITNKCNLLSFNRSNLYYQKINRKVNFLDGMVLETYLANEINDIWLAHPFYGYRKITKTLQNKGYLVNHKRILRLMQKMNISAIYSKPHLSRNNNKNYHKYPYLLKGLEIDKSNQV